MRGGQDEWCARHVTDEVHSGPSTRHGESKQGAQGGWCQGWMRGRWLKMHGRSNAWRVRSGRTQQLSCGTYKGMIDAAFRHGGRGCSDLELGGEITEAASNWCNQDQGSRISRRWRAEKLRQGWLNQGRGGQGGHRGIGNGRKARNSMTGMAATKNPRAKCDSVRNFCWGYNFRQKHRLGVVWVKLC